jgi:tetratricopeptide (TPR) repeat protein
LGQCYFKEHNYAKAAVCFEQAYQRDPLNLSCIYSYAQALMHNNQYKEAIGMFDLCMTHEQEFPHVVLYKIKCLHAAGEQDRAQGLLQAFLLKTLPGQVRTDAVELSRHIISC